MRLEAAVCVALMAAAQWAGAQEARLDDAITYLSGASSPEELDENEIERFTSLASRRVNVNTAPESRLVASGLFTRYQAASLADYRKRAGDILSVAELALVDGFDEALASALEPFVSFATSAPPGRSSLERGGFAVESLARTAVRRNEDGEAWNYGFKCRIGDSDRWEAALAAKSPYGGSIWPPDAISGSAAVYGRRLLSKAVAGDFNARFGQGLLLWSGFSLSGVSTAGGFAKHPSGVSPAWTMSPEAAHRGAAVELSFGRLYLSSFAAVDGLAGVNLSYYARSGQLGVTALSEGRASADWRWSLGTLDFFGEVAGDPCAGVAAFVTGLTWNPAYQVRASVSARDYPSAFSDKYSGAQRSSTHTRDERGLSVGLDYRTFAWTADWCAHPSKATSQFKSVMKWTPAISDMLAGEARVTARHRPADPCPWRADGRLSATLSGSGGLSLKGCAACAGSRSFSWLFYAEGGFLRERSDGRFSAYIRGTAFKVDHWEDRIYIYERDIPGAFSVPAYYGRGVSLSAVVSYKYRRTSLSIRASMTGYPGMIQRKPGKAELKFQFQTVI